MRMMVMIASVLMTIVCVSPAGEPLYAQEKMVLNASDGFSDVLRANIGKRVAVKTDTGEAQEGTVSTVGTQLVRLEKLSGKDFYDAIVRIDRISSLTIRARGN
jgi:hypothetical protein